ncbi:MAG: GNAT family N-acetyltransferase [Lachnospiraceae bacterium]|jgi:predicted acetyltransferase|nr:GNAT family N-acetyltransferase [Lachnospiraceae bacterium]
MNIELVKASNEYKEQLIEMLTEWKNDIITNHTNVSPRKIWAYDFHDFDHYVKSLDTMEQRHFMGKIHSREERRSREETENGLVPDTTRFCLDKDRNIFVGAVNIRHYLNDGLLRTGGHIGAGIRPGERRKGYATAMIGLALEECRKLGIDKVLITCDKDNIGSAKSIINNGGVLENEVEEDGHMEQRYWIQL